MGGPIESDFWKEIMDLENKNGRNYQEELLLEDFGKVRTIKRKTVKKKKKKDELTVSLYFIYSIIIFYFFSLTTVFVYRKHPM